MRLTKTLLFGIIIGILSFFFLPDKILANLIFEDNFSSINNNFWVTNTNLSGNIEIVDNSILRLSSSSDISFPYVYLKNVEIPDNNYTIEIKYKLSGDYNYGSGIIFSDILLPYNTNNLIALPDTFFQIWPDSVPVVWINSTICRENSLGCAFPFFSRISSTNFNEWNTLKIVSDGDNKYFLFVNGILQFESIISQEKIKQIWFGNPEKTNTLTIRPTVEVDYLSISSNEEVYKPTIIIPGFGASWDLGAILMGSTGGNWQIPDFITQYDGLINSFINAGYVENSNLFVYPYDWRKPLDIQADNLKAFIDEKIQSGEKVNLVGHSMGGLVSRSYAQKYGINKVNKIVTVGSPNMGVTEAYGVWEGATVWNDAWWSKVALDLTTHFGALSNEVQTVRELVPSIKDLLPVYDFLKFDGNVVPWSSLSQSNSYLSSLNNDFSSIDSLTTAIFSNNLPTDKFIKVTSTTPEDIALNKWVDGTPIENPFEQIGGDGTVIEESAKGPFSNIVQGSWWHGELVTKKDNIQAIFGVLGLDESKALDGVVDNRENAFVVALRSPGQLEVCNVDLSSCNNQLGLYFSENKLFILPDYNNQNLVVKVTESGEQGAYKLHLGNINSTSNWTVVEGDLEFNDQLDIYNISSNGTDVTANLVDTVSPSVPMITGFHNPELSCGGTTNLHTITVDWTDSTDNRGVVGYEYFVDYPLLSGRGQWTTFFSNSQYRGTLNEGIHYIKVRAKDSAGNYSEWSNICSITADWTAPVVNISSPIEGTYQPNSLPQLVFSATDNLDTELTIEKSELPKSEGQHTVIVTATDNAGNTAFDSVTYTIKKSAGNYVQCKKFGWKYFWPFRFRNQGECISYFERIERLMSLFQNRFGGWSWLR